MSKSTGKVSATNSETQGICIEKVWYNAEDIWKYAKYIKKGDLVDINYDENGKGNPLSYIKKIEPDSAFEKGNEVKGSSSDFRTPEQIMRCVSIESATGYLANEKEKNVEKIIEMAKIFYSWIEKGG